MYRNERILNQYFNKGKFNYPSEIGYVMNSIRECKPLTQEEWEMFYLENVRPLKHLQSLSMRMYTTIPTSLSISADECLDYIKDAIFRRTFEGYNKENEALKILRMEITSDVMESPKEWDGEYFIDFYLYSKKGTLIGIQLKPETFYLGRYYRKVDINGKLSKFRKDYDAKTFVLMYRKGDRNQIILVNAEEIDKINRLKNEG